MKLNKTTILGIVYVLMICGAHVLAANRKLHSSRRFSNKRIKTSFRQACPPESSEKLNYWIFFENLYGTATSTAVDDLIEKIKSFILPPQLTLDQCKEAMEAEYKKQLDLLVKDRMIQDKVEENFKIFGYILQFYKQNQNL